MLKFDDILVAIQPHTPADSSPEKRYFRPLDIKLRCSLKQRHPKTDALSWKDAAAHLKINMTNLTKLIHGFVLAPKE